MSTPESNLKIPDCHLCSGAGWVWHPFRREWQLLGPSRKGCAGAEPRKTQIFNRKLGAHWSHAALDRIILPA